MVRGSLGGDTPGGSRLAGRKVRAACADQASVVKPPPAIGSCDVATKAAYVRAVKSDDGKIYWIDTIEHEGGLWLVPKWLATTYPQTYKPARMIQMDWITTSSAQV